MHPAGIMSNTALTKERLLLLFPAPRAVLGTAGEPELCPFWHCGSLNKLGIGTSAKVGCRRGHHVLGGSAAPGAQWLRVVGRAAM